MSTEPSLHTSRQGPTAPSRKPWASAPQAPISPLFKCPQDSLNKLETAHGPSSGPLCLPDPLASPIPPWPISQESMGFPSDFHAPQCPVRPQGPHAHTSRSWGPSPPSAASQQPSVPPVFHDSLKPTIPRKDPRTCPSGSSAPHDPQDSPQVTLAPGQVPAHPADGLTCSDARGPRPRRSHRHQRLRRHRTPPSSRRCRRRRRAFK